MSASNRPIAAARAGHDHEPQDEPAAVRAELPRRRRRGRTATPRRRAGRGSPRRGTASRPAVRARGTGRPRTRPRHRRAARAGRSAGPVGVRGVIRSTRKVRQSSRSRSQATRYQRPPQVTRWCGSTRRGVAPVGRRSRSAAPRGRARRALSARSTAGSTAGAGGPFDGGDLEGVDAVAQPRGHDLPHGGQRPRRRPPRCPAPGGRGDLQRDRERDGLLVVEQQRRQLGAGVEPVPAVGALGGRDRVAELAQAVDVAADGARADVEPLGQQRRPASRGAPAAARAATAVAPRSSAWSRCCPEIADTP